MQKVENADYKIGIKFTKNGTILEVIQKNNVKFSKGSATNSSFNFNREKSEYETNIVIPESIIKKNALGIAKIEKDALIAELKIQNSIKEIKKTDGTSLINNTDYDKLFDDTQTAINAYGVAKADYEAIK